MTVVNGRYRPFTHYIGRPALLGNPFSCKDSKYKNVVRVQSDQEAIARFELYARSSPEIIKAIKRLPESAVLGCWCKPKDCHGDVIVKLWKEMNG